MKWKSATFEKVVTYNPSVEQIINTFKAQNLNGGALINFFKYVIRILFEKYD